jgi:tRNA(Ile)-lysidine synthase
MGIRARNNRIIRPLLFASRQLITAYAEDNALKWREDSSNQVTKYSRNKIRHNIIPAFESINPAFVQNAIDTAGRIESTGRLLDLVIDKIKGEVWNESSGKIQLDIDKLKRYPSNDVLLFELLKDYGVSQLSGEMLINTLDTSTGRQFHTRSHTITRNRNFLIITKRDTFTGSFDTFIDYDTVMIDFPVKMFFSIIENSRDFIIPTSRSSAALDADKIRFPMILRGWKKGDRFRPLGMKGTKKVSDFLINIKLPLPEKKHVWILESGGEIAWVINQRIDERFRISADTKRIFLIEYLES